MENKNKGRKNKIILGDLLDLENYIIVLSIKWTGIVEIKHKDFIDVVPVMPCQNASLIMGSRICEGGRTQISQSSLAVIDPLAQVSG